MLLLTPPGRITQKRLNGFLQNLNGGCVRVRTDPLTFGADVDKATNPGNSFLLSLTVQAFRSFH